MWSGAIFFKLLPWVIAGIIIGAFVGADVNEFVFRRMMSIIIVFTVVIMLWLEFRKNPLVPQNVFFASSLGLASGFTTMLGNLAGAFANIYFLAMRMSKNNFIGTAAWLFLFINLFKLPFQIFFWKNISANTLKIDLILLPALAIGFFAGLKIVARIKDANYRLVILALTFVGAVFIFFK